MQNKFDFTVFTMSHLDNMIELMPAFSSDLTFWYRYVHCSCSDIVSEAFLYKLLGFFYVSSFNYQYFTEKPTYAQ